ncbi:MAG: imidazolonepropionase [Planctomycetes bacterium]|nr:imidazolonepropionase [Planctomycetota bacterium]
MGHATAAPVDRLFVHCGELVTLADGPPTGARRGAAMQRLGVITDGAVAVRGGRIVATGTTDELGRRFAATDEIDVGGRVVLPGLVDCHTHPVFAATREGEFHLRCQGADYMAIAAQGGGILSSVRAVRAASEDALTVQTRAHLDGFLRHGTTTIEGKSGYGLSTADEVKSLRALTRAAAGHPVRVRRTFLGAHEVPEEYRGGRQDDYVALVVDEMLPAVDGLCEACDVFAEPKVFDLARSRRILTAARSRGLGLRVHADEIEPMGGAELAVELGAESADHLPQVSDAGVAALAGSDTTAVLLPGTSFYLGKPKHAPARRLLEAGAAVALSTDFNPGTCYTQSLPLIVTLACVLLHMTPEECIAAITINPAASLRLDAEIGTLHPGKRADLVALDLPSWRALGYAFGGNPVAFTCAGGEVHH